jgi:hypothetical protein
MDYVPHKGSELPNGPVWKLWEGKEKCYPHSNQIFAYYFGKFNVTHGECHIYGGTPPTLCVTDLIQPKEGCITGSASQSMSEQE